MQISNINATLSYGKFFSGLQKKFLYVVLCISLLTVILTISLFPVYMNELSLSEAIILLVANTLLIGGFAAYLFYLVLKNHKVERIILESIQDAVFVEADIRDITESSFDWFYSGAKIEVKFQYDGRKFCIDSGVQGKTNRLNGYDKVFRRYSNRKVQLLYSPKTGQIMFLKN